MIIQLPARGNLAAAELRGTTRLVSGGPAVDRAAVVLKAAYALQAAGTDPRIPVPSTIGGHHEIAYADTGSEQGGLFVVGYEADIALNKARSDIVIDGWLGEVFDGARGMEGDVRIDSALWFTRRAVAAAEVPEHVDAVENLLGWLARSLSPRVLEKPAVDPTESVLPPDYDAQFNNFHQRTGVAPGKPTYSTPLNRNASPLPDGALVSCSQWVKGAETDTVEYNFRLPAGPGYTAALRSYCGHGPDKARHWKVAARVPLHCDTLIAYPAEDRMVLLWRADWDPAQEPEGNWRMIQVLEGGA